MIKEAELKEVVKKASDSVSYEPTEDLFADMVRLANAMREKGFEKEAESLEDKIHTFKMAETHLYRAIDEDGEDVLESAHPDGDVEVAPSQGGYGVVETEESAHKKILDIVNKKPTGKYAEVIDDAIRSAAVALGVDLEKTADYPNLPKEWRLPSDKPKMSVEPKKEEPPKMPTGPVDMDSVAGELEDTYAEIGPLVFGALSALGLNWPIWTLNARALLKDQKARDSFAKATGQSPEDLNKYVALYNKYIVGDFHPSQGPRRIANKLKGNYEHLAAIGNETGQSKFFWGSQPGSGKKRGTKWGPGDVLGPSILKIRQKGDVSWSLVSPPNTAHDIWADNAQSVWAPLPGDAEKSEDNLYSWFRLDTKQVNAAALAIYNYLVAEFNAKFWKPCEELNEKTSAKLKKIAAKFTSAMGPISESPEINTSGKKEFAASVAAVISLLQAVKKKLETTFKVGGRWTRRIDRLAKFLGFEWGYVKYGPMIAQAITKITAAIRKFTPYIHLASDKPYYIDISRETYNNLSSAAVRLRGLLDRYEEGTKNYETTLTNYKATINYMAAVKAGNQSKKFFDTISALGPEFAGMSQEDVLSWSKQWNEGTKPPTRRRRANSALDDIVKQANPVPPVPAPLDAPPSGSPRPRGPSGKTPSAAQIPIVNKVMEMQTSMLKLKDTLNKGDTQRVLAQVKITKPEIDRVFSAVSQMGTSGPRSTSPADGKWGKKTAFALEQIESFRRKWNDVLTAAKASTISGTITPGPAGRGYLHDVRSAKMYAPTNKKIVEAMDKSVNYAVSKKYVGKTQLISVVVDLSKLQGPPNVKITNQDLASLSALQLYLEKHGIVKRWMAAHKLDEERLVTRVIRQYGDEAGKRETRTPITKEQQRAEPGLEQSPEEKRKGINPVTRTSIWPAKPQGFRFVYAYGQWLYMKDEPYVAPTGVGLTSNQWMFALALLNKQLEAAYMAEPTRLESFIETVKSLLPGGADKVDAATYQKNARILSGMIPALFGELTTVVAEQAPKADQRNSVILIISARPAPGAGVGPGGAGRPGGARVPAGRGTGRDRGVGGRDIVGRDVRIGPDFDPNRSPIWKTLDLNDTEWWPRIPTNQRTILSLGDWVGAEGPQLVSKIIGRARATPRARERAARELGYKLEVERGPGGDYYVATEKKGKKLKRPVLLRNIREVEAMAQDWSGQTASAQFLKFCDLLYEELRRIKTEFERMVPRSLRKRILQGEGGKPGVYWYYNEWLDMIAQRYQEVKTDIYQKGGGR